MQSDHSHLPPPEITKIHASIVNNAANRQAGCVYSVYIHYYNYNATDTTDRDANYKTNLAN